MIKRLERWSARRALRRWVANHVAAGATVPAGRGATNWRPGADGRYGDQDFADRLPDIGDQASAQAVAQRRAYDDLVAILSAYPEQAQGDEEAEVDDSVYSMF